jgi:uncharacterized membrane protein
VVHVQIFFASVGASGSISQVVTSAPVLFMFALVQVFAHLGLLLFVGQRWPRRTLLLASNANVGGPTTAAGMANAKGWKSSIVPSILIGADRKAYSRLHAPQSRCRRGTMLFT